MKNNKLLIPVLVISLVLVLGVVYFFRPSKTSAPSSTDNIVATPQAKKAPVEVLQENINEKTYQEIVEENPETINQPYISDAETRDEIYKNTIKNEDPQNFFVTVSTSGVDPSVSVLVQGDYVSFKNETGSAITIVGEDGWQLNDIENGSYLTTGFDFIGDYKYDVKSGEVVLTSGTVSVVKIDPAQPE